MMDQVHVTHPTGRVALLAIYHIVLLNVTTMMIIVMMTDHTLGDKVGK